MDATGRQGGQGPVAHALANEAGLLPASRRHINTPSGHANAAVSAQRLAEKEILHESELRKTVQAPEAIPAQEKSLIAINHAGQTHACSGAGINAAVQPATSAHAHAKAAGYEAASRRQALRLGQGPRFQGTIRVQEQEH